VTDEAGQVRRGAVEVLYSIFLSDFLGFLGYCAYCNFVFSVKARRYGGKWLRLTLIPSRFDKVAGNFTELRYTVLKTLCS
jgi:lipocalin